MRRSLSLFVAMATAAGLSVSPSAGAETSGYSGTDCVIAQFPIVAPYYEGTSLKNIGSAAQQLVCPAVQTGGPLTGGSMAGRDWNGSQAVICHGRARNATDTGGVVTPSATSGAAFVGAYNVSFGAATAPGFYADGSKVVICTLPGTPGGEGSSLASYHITES